MGCWRKPTQTQGQHHKLHREKPSRVCRLDPRAFDSANQCITTVLPFYLFTRSSETSRANRFQHAYASVY